MDNDWDIDDLLAEASGLRVAPSEELAARILSDAARVQPQPVVFKLVSAQKRGGFLDWLPGFAEGLGGARTLVGLSFAGLTGLFLGAAEPTLLQSLTAVLSGQSMQIDQLDLLPATDLLWTEN